MAAVEVIISGVIYDKYSRTSRPVVLIGDATLAGLGVGGGPIYPPEGGGQPPLGIWGPPGPWVGWPADPGIPGNTPGRPPIQPPEGPADENGFIKPPPEGGGWGYHEVYGWGYYPKAGQSGPKSGAQT